MDQNLNLNQNVDTLFTNLENFTQTEGVIGKPVTHEGKTFIPVVSLSIGYGGGNTASKTPPSSSQTTQTSGASTSPGNMSGGALGLGAKVTTDGIIVIDNDKISMMTLNAASNMSQVMDKVPEIIKNMNQGQQQSQ